MKKVVFVVGCGLALMTARAQGRDEGHGGGGRGVDSGRVEDAARVMRAAACKPVCVRGSGLTLELKGVYVCDGLLWLSFSASNKSSINFRANAVRLVIRDRKALKRRALQEMVLQVVFRQEPPVLPSDSTVRFCDGVVPRVPGKRQELVVEWMERNGDRRVMMRVSSKRVLRARKVE